MPQIPLICYTGVGRRGYSGLKEDKENKMQISPQFVLIGLIPITTDSFGNTPVTLNSSVLPTSQSLCSVTDPCQLLGASAAFAWERQQLSSFGSCRREPVLEKQSVPAARHQSLQRWHPETQKSKPCKGLYEVSSSTPAFPPPYAPLGGNESAQLVPRGPKLGKDAADAASSIAGPGGNISRQPAVISPAPSSSFGALGSACILFKEVCWLGKAPNLLTDHFCLCEIIRKDKSTMHNNKKQDKAWPDFE